MRTQAEICEAVAMYQRGASLTEVALAMGCARQSVLNWLRSHGVTTRSRAEGMALVRWKRPVARSTALEKFVTTLEASAGSKPATLAKIVREGLAALPPKKA